ncbi:MAG: hypothetical protein ACEY3L_04105 [Wolbachia sp.]|uniref:hypothetical protein n=1 Tax=Wolbachia endosymbiont (group A) of Tiphia femorata TaxID=2954063 RepID=UPI00223067B8|nr:hypothetical protein [Wolbachia endosymbiont (group A) of Tiphia femorata]
MPRAGMTAVLRHTVAVSLDPANKQRDDDCQGVIRVAPSPVIPVLLFLLSE